MCGVVTIVAMDGRTVPSAVLERMTESLAHRGPDDFGYACIDPRTGSTRAWTSAVPAAELSGMLLGHRRLSILDLTPGGHQPMFNDDGSMAIAFNGEIYNYIELRDELQKLGVVFRTRSDTEVLLKAYEHWGDAAFARFNGMWAFTLWDGRKGSLIACRDRFGVKPLYCAVTDGVTLFASEIKALLAFPGAHRGFNDDNIRAYVTRNGALDGDDSTMFHGIWSVSPGSYVEIGANGTSRRRYWTLAVDGRFDGLSAERLTDQYRDLLTDAVRLRMRSDVPIGTMLSGGLDSTSITALICEQQAALGAAPLTDAVAPAEGFHHTFTACWPGWTGDEEADVSAFCANLGLDSHKVYLTSEAMASAIGKVVYHLDEPFTNPTSLVQYLLMERARSYGLKVVLNGHGSDEVLAGYPCFVLPFLAQLLLSSRPFAFIRNVRRFGAGMRLRGRSIYGELRGALANRRGRSSAPATGTVSPWDSDAFRRTPYFRRPETMRSTAGPSLLSAALWRHFTTRTLPRWLRMEDRMSMAWSIESRLPFMDYRLVEVAFNLADDFKLADGLTKVVLRNAMKGRLPESIRANPHKKRFNSPYGQWLRREWRPLVEDSLGGGCRLRDHMDLAGFSERLGRFFAGDPNVLEANMLWRAVNAELFLRTFGEQPGRTGGEAFG